MVRRPKAKYIPVTQGSDNVFADLGFAAPEEELNKAQLASHIRQIIKRRRLTQAAAAALMEIDQPKVSALLNGRLVSRFRNSFHPAASSFTNFGIEGH